METDNMTANKIRIWLLEQYKQHPKLRLASCLSCVEILMALKSVMQEKDQLIISKAHGAAPWYYLQGHRSLDELPLISEHGTAGLVGSCGSLGNGLSMGIGVALSNHSRHVYVLAGDGELDEGNMLEAMAYLSRDPQSNLTLIIDANGRAMRRAVDVKIGCIVNHGHSVPDIVMALEARHPIITVKTVKGKGVDLLEGNQMSHVLSLSEADIQLAIERLQ